jgi:hypothetical protein
VVSSGEALAKETGLEGVTNVRVESIPKRDIAFLF